jgi:CspA family cold shock protein
MNTGTLIAWVEGRGFGFIRPDTGGDDVFVHISAFEAVGLGVPAKGERYAFDTESDHRNNKPRAVNPRPASI